MRLYVTARNWDVELQKKFGKCDSENDFPDDAEEFIKFVHPFGRFRIMKGDEYSLKMAVELGEFWAIEFQNDYD